MEDDNPELFKLLTAICTKDVAKIKRALKATSFLHQTMLQFVCDKLGEQSSFYTSENHWCTLRTTDIEIVKNLTDAGTLGDWERWIPWVPTVLHAICGRSMPANKNHTVVVCGAALLFARNPQCGAYQTLADCLYLSGGLDSSGFSRFNLGSSCHYRPDVTIGLLKQQQAREAAELVKKKNALLPPEVLGSLLFVSRV
jgi:hypothetical protein